jgi:hypothetical protein
MEKSSQIALKIVPLRHFFSLKVVPLIEVLLYSTALLEYSQVRDTRMWAHVRGASPKKPFDKRDPSLTGTRLYSTQPGRRAGRSFANPGISCRVLDCICFKV